MVYLRRFNDDAQLLILAGLTMVMAIIIIASISAQLSNLRSPTDQGSNLEDEFKMVRDKLGESLLESMGDDFEEKVQELGFSDNSWVTQKVEFITDTFAYAELKHNYDLHIDFDKINDRGDGILLDIYLSDGDETLYEKVEFYIYKTEL